MTPKKHIKTDNIIICGKTANKLRKKKKITGIFKNYTDLLQKFDTH